MQFSKQLRPASLPLQQWFGNVPGDLIAGIVVALALIPEAIAFSIVAGVDPKVGLYASFTIGVITAFCGGRAGMISGATGAMALLVGHLVHSHGVAYLFAATILTGIIQMAFGGLRLSRYMSFVPRSVMLGFVNALAILIFLAQLPHFHGAGWQTYAMVALGLAVIYLLPRLTRAVPAPLVAIAVVTVLTLLFRWKLPTVGDMGQLPTTLPTFQVPGVPLNLQTLQIILPVALPLALVGILESLLTAQIVDQLTDTSSDKNREAVGQGIANVATGVLGGMAGCAMIGQSVINVKSGGKGRLSSLVAGCFLLVLILAFSPLLKIIPMAALVAVMIMVSISTFDWSSLKRVSIEPRGETITTVVTVVTVVMTHDLAKGVIVGVILSTLLFARKVSKFAGLRSELSNDGRVRTYAVTGELFFVSANRLAPGFDLSEPVQEVVIDLSEAHVWDGSAIAVLDRVILGFRSRGVNARLDGVPAACRSLVDRVAIHDKAGALEPAASH
ncbi:MAG: SulP family inorganic anion transporter [Armatimonadota bacterium]